VFETDYEGPPLFVLRTLDGNTWSYNDGPNDPPGPDKPEWDAHLGEYTILFRGSSIADVRIHKKNGYLYLDDIKLVVEHEPGLFFTTTGEAVDFRGSSPTAENIPLVCKHEPPT
jgi:hypothetical protein